MKLLKVDDKGYIFSCEKRGIGNVLVYFTQQEILESIRNSRQYIMSFGIERYVGDEIDIKLKNRSLSDYKLEVMFRRGTEGMLIDISLRMNINYLRQLYRQQLNMDVRFRMMMFDSYDGGGIINSANQIDMRGHDEEIISSNVGQILSEVTRLPAINRSLTNPDMNAGRNPNLEDLLGNQLVEEIYRRMNKDRNTGY